MCTVKDLFENEELMNNIVEDIEDIPEDTEVFYAVWALGCNSEADPTDDEVLVGEFTDPDAAVEYAKQVTFETINEMGFGEPDPDTVYFSIDVETVVGNPDDEDGGTMNIGTIYQRDLWIDGDYGSAEEAGLDEADSVISLTDKDFELLEDGTMKISCALLKDYNKNDYVTFEFPEEDLVAFLTYKIVSKVIYADGDYYHCELQL
jgi:hypothetical protein